MKANPSDHLPKLSTRDQLLRATESLLLRYGPAKVSTRAVGAEAGVRWSLVTYYFDGLPNLLSELATQNMERIHAARSTMMAKALGERKKGEKLDAVISAYIDPLVLTSSAFSHPSAAIVIRTILLDPDLPARDKIVARLNDNVNFVADVLAQLLPDLSRDLIITRLRFINGMVEITMPHVERMGLYPLKQTDPAKRDKFISEQLHAAARTILTSRPA